MRTDLAVLAEERFQISRSGGGRQTADPQVPAVAADRSSAFSSCTRDSMVSELHTDRQTETFNLIQSAHPFHLWSQSRHLYHPS